MLTVLQRVVLNFSSHHANAQQTPSFFDLKIGQPWRSRTFQSRQDLLLRISVLAAAANARAVGAQLVSSPWHHPASARCRRFFSIFPAFCFYLNAERH
jgi:hypothetical protein